ncbi:hypothetical protein JCM6882_008679 [Rhodosporidiobolus microsporus]
MLRSVLALSALAGAVVAQTGYGRFPCTIVNGDGTFSADQTQCANDNLIAPGADTADAVNQGDFPNPVDSQCVIETESGAYFCGIAGAECATDDNCDNGVCGADGTCQGGFTQDCGGVDTNCLGFLYCLTGDFTETTANTCGAEGAFCQDYAAADGSLTVAEAQPFFNQFCASGYCNSISANCDTLVALGEDCSADPDFICGSNARCDTETNPDAPVCVALPVASGGARARRNLHAKRNLCPASHEACSVPGVKGFECIDVTSNLEQCGACASAGGVDCTALPGVESVGCVAGTCEIWACAEGFSWDQASQSCQA